MARLQTGASGQLALSPVRVGLAHVTARARIPRQLTVGQTVLEIAESHGRATLKTAQLMVGSGLGPLGQLAVSHAAMPHSTVLVSAIPLLRSTTGLTAQAISPKPSSVMAVSCAQLTADSLIGRLGLRAQSRALEEPKTDRAPALTPPLSI